MSRTTVVLTVALACAFALACVALPAAADDVDARFYKSDSHASFRDHFPRFGNPKELPDNLKTIDDEEQYGIPKYAVGLMAATVFSAAVGIAAILVVCCTACFRCCCRCCCGGGKPDEKGYTPRDRAVPAVVLAVAMLWVVGWVIAGLVSNQHITSSVRGDPHHGLVYQVDRVLLDAGDLVQRVSDPIDTADQILSDVVSQAQNVIATVSSAADTGLTDVIAKLNNLGAVLTSSVDRTIGGTTFHCEVCATAASQVASVSSSVSSTSDSVLSSIRSAIHSADSELVDTRTTIEDNLNEVRRVFQQVNVVLGVGNNRVRDASDRYVDNYDEKRRAAVIGLFMLPIVAVVFGVLGLALRKKLPFTLMFIFTGLTLIVYTLIIIPHVPLSLVMGDSCRWMNGHQSSWSSVQGLSGETATRGLDVMDTCMRNTPLSAAFDVSGLDFATAIEFPAELSDTTWLQFPQLDAMVAQVNQLSLANTFGVQPAVTDGYLAQLGVENGGLVYTRANWTAAPSSSQRDVVQQAIDLEDTLLDVIGDLKTASRALQDSVNTATSDLLAAQASVLELKDSLTPLSDIVYDLVHNVRCGFLGDFYANTKELMCVDLVGSLTVTSLSIFMIMLGCLFLGIGALVAGKRIPNPAESGANHGYADDGAVVEGGGAVQLVSYAPAPPMSSPYGDVAVGYDNQYPALSTPPPYSSAVQPSAPVEGY